MSVHRVGGTPVSGSFSGLWSQVVSGGGGGVYPNPGGGGDTPGQYPLPGLGYPPPPNQDWGIPRDRTAERVFATRRVVCLLHSRRRTFLFIFLFSCVFRMCLYLYARRKVTSLAWLDRYRRDHILSTPGKHYN